MIVAIVNCGFGNIGSVRRTLEELGATPRVAASPEQLEGADRLILPGVGAFSEAFVSLHNGGWVTALRERVAAGTPLLGICLGMQLLADASDENGLTTGLGFIAGHVRRLDALGCRNRIPHVGWNEVRAATGSRLLQGIPQDTDFYFVHSFAFDAVDPSVVTATTEYGVPLTAVVECGVVAGTQFHPEKSSRAGRQVLRNFLEGPAC